MGMNIGGGTELEIQQVLHVGGNNSKQIFERREEKSLESSNTSKSPE